MVLGEPETGPYAPVAFWPQGRGSTPGLANAAEMAMAERRGVIRQDEADSQGGGPRLCNPAYPFVIDERLHGVVAIAITDRTRIGNGLGDAERADRLITRARPRRRCACWKKGQRLQVPEFRIGLLNRVVPTENLVSGGNLAYSADRRIVFPGRERWLVSSAQLSVTPTAAA